jgi:hypothetical protein
MEDRGLGEDYGRERVWMGSMVRLNPLFIQQLSHSAQTAKNLMVFASR